MVMGKDTQVFEGKLEFCGGGGWTWWEFNGDILEMVMADAFEESGETDRPYQVRITVEYL